ncbi:serine--tRNA ligase [candidate division KSB1 bacterium]
MLDMKFIRSNPDLVRKAIENKNEKVDFDKLLELDEEWRKIIAAVEELKHKRNIVTEEIRKLKMEKQNADELINETKKVSEEIKSYDEKVRSIEDEINKIMIWLPNIPHESVKVGHSEEDNVEIKKWGDLPEFDFPILDHMELAQKLDIIDFKRSSKISGSGFPLYKGLGARLERGIINFMLDVHTKKGYTEIIPPLMVTDNTAFGTGQLPKLSEDMYFCEKDNLYLIPTAEVPVTNIFKDEILYGDKLPVKFVAYTPCFRREAGSWGRDTRGFNRMHQFNKVELVKIVEPENSYDELETLLADAENILQLLGLHYRVLELCTGDLSFAAAKCYDIEVWSPGENKYLEVSSCSNFVDFQARRMDIRYRKEKGSKPEFVHTLNGSGVATARLMIALLETYQTDENSVMVPEALVDYVGTNIIKIES